MSGACERPRPSDLRVPANPSRKTSPQVAEAAAQHNMMSASQRLDRGRSFFLSRLVFPEPFQSFPRDLMSLQAYVFQEIIRHVEQTHQFSPLPNSCGQLRDCRKDAKEQTLLPIYRVGASHLRSPQISDLVPRTSDGGPTKTRQTIKRPAIGESWSRTPRAEPQGNPALARPSTMR